MTETLILFAGALLLAVSVATLVVAVRTLRTARAYVDLAEERLERLREGQAYLAGLIEDQRRAAEEAREEAVPEAVRARQGAERSIERAKQDLLERREVRRPTSRPPETRVREQHKPPTEPPKLGKTPPPAGLPETRSPKTAKAPRDQEPPRRAVVRPHPDDDVRPGGARPGGAPAARTETSGTSPTRMFRVFYDRYLDNYEGYVKLAERLHTMRTDDEKVPGSSAERDWQERLRRVNDGVQRTTVRLDILEHSNPELASDDRVSRRAAIARGHSRFTN